MGDLFLTLISVLCFGTAWFFVENKVRSAVYFLPVLNIFVYINVPVTVYEIYCTGVFIDVSLGMYRTGTFHVVSCLLIIFFISVQDRVGALPAPALI